MIAFLLLSHAYSLVECKIDGTTITYSGTGILTKYIVRESIQSISSTHKFKTLIVTGNVFDIGELVFEYTSCFNELEHIVLRGVCSIQQGCFDTKCIKTFEFDSCLTSFQGNNFDNSRGIIDLDMGNHITQISSYVIYNMRSVKVGKKNLNFEENDGSSRYILNKGGKTLFSIVDGSKEIDLVFPESVTMAMRIINEHHYIKSIDFNNVEIIHSSFYDGFLAGILDQYYIKNMRNVRIIQDNVFAYCSNTTINLPSSLEYISSSAIRDGVEVIISNCQYYRTIYPNTNVVLFVDEVEKTILFRNTILNGSDLTIDGYSMPEGYFKGYEFEDVIIQNIKTVPRYCFQEATMKSLTIGVGVETLSLYSFNKMTSVSYVDVKLDSSIKAIMPFCFTDAKANFNGLPLSLDTIGDNSFYGVESSVDHNLIIPINCTFVQSRTFGNWAQLKSITLQEGLLSFDTSAITGTGITSLNLPSSIQGFNSVPSSLSITVNGLTSADSIFYYDSSNTTLVTTDMSKLNDNDNLIFPGISTIGYMGFASIKKTVTMEFPDIVKISDSAFKYATVQKLIFGSKCEYIADNSFFICKVDELIFESSSFNFVGENAFYGGLTVTKLQIPPVTVVNGMINLAKTTDTLSYTINGVTMDIQEIDGLSTCIFNQENVSMAKLIYPCDSILLKENVKNIEDLSGVYTMFKTRVEIDCYLNAFPDLEFLIKLKITSKYDKFNYFIAAYLTPANTEFGPDSIYQMINDKVITKDGKTLVYCFYTDDGADLSTLPNTVTDVAADAFYFLIGKTIEIPSHITTLKEGSINGAMSFIVNEGLKTIEYNTFQDVVKFNIPSSVETISNSEIGKMIAEGTMDISKSKIFIVDDNVVYSSDHNAAYDVVDKSVSTISFDCELVNVYSMINCTNLDKIKFSDKLVSFISDFQGTNIHQRLPKAKRFKGLIYSNFYGQTILNGTDDEISNFGINEIPPGATDIFFYSNHIPDGLSLTGNRYFKFFHVYWDFVPTISSVERVTFIRNLEEYNIDDFDNIDDTDDIDDVTKSKGLSCGAIAGIIIGVIVFIALVVFIIFFIFKRKKDDDDSNDQNIKEEPNEKEEVTKI